MILLGMQLIYQGRSPSSWLGITEIPCGISAKLPLLGDTTKRSWLVRVVIFPASQTQLYAVVTRSAHLPRL